MYNDYNLRRFHHAQDIDYKTALAEIRAGKKQTHWMWFIFPQIHSIGRSQIAQYYAISGIEEARAYLKDKVLKKRIVEISKAILKLKTNNATEVMGAIDDKKLQSSMTLFEAADPECEVFRKVLEKFYKGERCELTLRILSTPD